MKPKLKIFENFSQSILPHESCYLSKLSNFQDVGKLDIFNKVLHNAMHPEDIQEFDDEIDKRKYHYIKSWIENKLALIDVDKVGDWILDFKRKLYLDLITSKDEKEILEYIKSYQNITFNFHILYDTMRDYRSYLMIRLRYEDHNIIKQFLEQFAESFDKSTEIKEKLYLATTDITQHYTSKSNDTIYWEKWLYKVFTTKEIDGSNRYKAFILLAFLYNSNGNTSKLQLIFDDIDEFFAQGEMYCRRLLYNYYSSRVLLHSKKDDIKTAIYYGKLSVRQDNEDTLMYVNNLVSIYIRSKQFSEAKEVLEQYQSYFENSHNNYRRITYMSYQIRVLSELNQLLTAENLGLYFIKKYEDEILQYRWHHFFTSHFNVLLLSEKYDSIVALEKRYNLSDMELDRKKKKNYIPNLSWGIWLSRYMENTISKEELMVLISNSLEGVLVTKENEMVYEKTVNIITKNLPELNIIFKSHLVKSLKD